MKKNIGIIREGKTPPDSRVPLIPAQCKKLNEEYERAEVFVQHSVIRCFKDSEYSGKGIELREDMSNCDILLGIKEVPVEMLIPGKTYLFFSHTIKQQEYNRKLLQTILERKIRLIDYECITDSRGRRLIGFGRYAGIVGCYNGLLAYGLRYNRYQLKPAHRCEDRVELEKELSKVNLPNIKIVLTGYGRVSRGAVEILEKLSIRKVSPEDFIEYEYDEPVYTQLDSMHYHENKYGAKWDTADYYKNPKNYISTFMQYAKVADMYIAGHYWDPEAPFIFTKKDAQMPDFKIKVVADISCDINGPIPSTIRASTIEDPIYGYDPDSGKEVEYKEEGAITVMAVDNLPCELPKDASEDFGNELMKFVFPYLLDSDNDGRIARATIAENGKLTAGFQYLSDFVREIGEEA